MSANTGLQAPCGGCGDDAGPIHRCPSCFVHMHPFCGTAVGAEGFGQFILCPACQTKEQEPPPASPIVAALSLQKERGKVADKGGATECPQYHSIDLASFNEETKSEDGDEPPLAHDDTEVSDVPETELGRSTLRVSTIQQRRRVIAWLESYMKKKGKKNMCARAVDEFPDVFISATRNANLSKAINWWKKRETFAKVAREFDFLRKLGLKFDYGLLRQLALRMLRRPGAPEADANGVLLEKKINTRWVQSFMETHNIILRAQSGKR
ncbi:hypothetical protein PHYSODRAFT_304282 [Phytophthora sojae]|uniref:SCAN domain-containing protein n=1 Tax=Phytophthora sojae (strain P6497) TaxID=1094619 RepID=G4ZZG2_PHYSP|nr:hypothetical protein PHYSODRAFT_304282 [Phytophthora sojae]EGZ10362.1 hypothetical protein PHYSODRAFT_304282 [Phytophthora sojae]|eukprot:XP_009533107.1 hypothetical protein PHYSODRAFT_304282 [Phytophthora sojae]